MSYKTEINIKRFLWKMEQMAEQKDLNHLQFKAHLEALYDLVQQFEKENIHHSSKNSVIHEYYRKINILQTLIDPQKLQSPAEKGLSHQRKITNRYQTQSEKTKEIQNEMKRSQYLNQQKREELFIGSFETIEKYLSNNYCSSPYEEVDEDGVRLRLQKQQSHYEQEMTQMIQQLKMNAEAIGSIARQDASSMETFIESMSQGQGRLSKILQRTKALSQYYGQTCWLQILLMLLVTLVFLFMYFFIRFFPKRRIIQSMPVVLENDTNDFLLV